MVVKTIESPAYKNLATRENIIAIDRSINKHKGVFPYNIDVIVSTDKKTYFFSCVDKKCSEMHIGGWSYSIYQDE